MISVRNAQDVMDPILQEFDSKADLFATYEPRVRALIQQLLDERAELFHLVTSRVKKRQSLERKLREKVERKRDAPYTSLRDVTDILGARVVTYFQDDVDVLTRKRPQSHS